MTFGLFVYKMIFDIWPFQIEMLVDQSAACKILLCVGCVLLDRAYGTMYCTPRFEVRVLGDGR